MIRSSPGCRPTLPTPPRRFARRLSPRWTELFFFERWFRNRSDELRDAVKTLVTGRQLEFALAGWSGAAHEGVTFDDLLADYADAQQWLANTFGTHCLVAYVPHQHAVSSQALRLLKEGGVEFVVVDGADAAYWGALKAAQSEEFLWETSRFLGGESRVLVHINGDDAAAQPFWDAFEAARMGDTSSLQAVAEQEAQQLKAGDRALFLWPFETSEGARSLDSLQATLDSLAAAEGLVVGSSCVSLLTQSVFARTLRVGPVWRRRAAARAKLRPAPAAAAPVLHGTLQRGSVARLPHTVSQRRRGHSQSGVALSRRIRALLRLLLAPPRVSHRPLQHARYSGLLRLRLHPAREAR